MWWKAKKKVSKAIALVREGGVGDTLRRSLRFLWVLGADAYWRLRGLRTMTVDGHTVTVCTKNTALGPYGFFEINEHSLVSRLLDELEPDDVFYDVGAYTGLYSCFAARVITEGDIVAVEPYPANVRVMRQNLRRNQAAVRVVEAALSDTHGTANLEDPPGPTTSGIVSLTTDTEQETVRVQATTGERLVADGAPPPTVVKIDVEGAEAHVLRGMEDLLRREACRYVICEIHVPVRYRQHSMMTDPEVTRALLEDMGFEIERVPTARLEYHLIGRKSDSARG